MPQMARPAEINIINSTEGASAPNAGLNRPTIIAVKAANENRPRIAAGLDHGLAECKTKRVANRTRDRAAVIFDETPIIAPLTKYDASICEIQYPVILAIVTGPVLESTPDTALINLVFTSPPSPCWRLSALRLLADLHRFLQNQNGAALDACRSAKPKSLQRSCRGEAKRRRVNICLCNSCEAKGKGGLARSGSS